MKYLLLFLLTLGTLTSCTKDAEKCNQEEQGTCVDGIVFWGGQPAADGTGWYIAASENATQRYHVKTLPQEFQVVGKAVRACLQVTSEPIPCFCMGTPPPYYRIVSLSGR